MNKLCKRIPNRIKDSYRIPIFSGVDPSLLGSLTILLFHFNAVIL